MAQLNYNYFSTVKKDVGLVSVVQSAGVELKRSGSRHTGSCPWHEDITPSLVIYSNDSWYCFSCQIGGDVFDFVQKLHSCDFKQALSILGIKPERLTPQKRRQIKQLQHQRELVKAFRQWEIDAADGAAMLCRCCRNVLGEIKTEADLDRHGDLYHGLESYQYHLDLLTGNNDEAKLELYYAGYYG